jgi:hypothetical protein
LSDVQTGARSAGRWGVCRGRGGCVPVSSALWRSMATTSHAAHKALTLRRACLIRSALVHRVRIVRAGGLGGRTGRCARCQASRGEGARGVMGSGERPRGSVLAVLAAAAGVLLGAPSTAGGAVCSLPGRGARRPRRTRPPKRPRGPGPRAHAHRRRRAHRRLVGSRSGPRRLVAGL